jgi:hypothetical protein
MLRDKVCRPTNEELGKLDEALVRTAPEALFRVLAGVKGRSGHPPTSPFYYDPLNPDAVRVMGKHPDNDYEVLWEIDPGTMKGREARQVVFRHDERIIPLPLPKGDIIAFLKRVMKGKGLEGREMIAFFCDEDEYGAVMEAVHALVGEGKVIVSSRLGEPGHIVRVSSALSITRTHLRAVTKIALHYLLANVPANIMTGHEPAFDAAKRFIMADENFEGRVALSREPMVEDIASGRKLKWYAHLLHAEIGYTKIVVRAQFFVGPAVAAPTWVVRLASNPSRVYTDFFGHGFMLFEERASDGHQGEVTELTAIRRSLLPR